MTRPDADRLADIVDYVDRIAQYRAHPGRASADAILYCLVVIGEAANGLSAEVRARAPEIPWRAVVDMRNLVAHGYFGVDPEVVEAVLTTRLGPLRAAVERLLQSWRPSSAARNVVVSTVSSTLRLTDRAPCPTSVSRR